VNLKLRCKTFLLVAPRYIQLDLHTDEFTDVPNDAKSQQTTIYVRGAMDGGYRQNQSITSIYAVGGSQRAYLRIATSNHTATRHHFVAIVLF
jgi:hypothetical protein